MNAAFAKKLGAAPRQSLRARRRVARSGLTLVEIIIAVTLSALLVTSAVQVFSMLGEGINEAQSALEGADRLRSAAAQLERDLGGITADMIPPVSHGGYFELIEGNADPGTLSKRESGGADSTVGDVDDILMFTTQNYTVPFVGRVGNRVVTSNTAEVAWFLRGTNLYRRVLLVKPSLNSVDGAAASSYYLTSDISANASGGAVRANSLDDLMRRENRFGHDASAYPFLAYWGDARLPTLGDSASHTVGQVDAGSMTVPTYPIDFWVQPFQEAGNPTDGNSVRAREDIILTNVLMFDVKVWDPSLNDYVDLGQAGSLFDALRIDPRSGLTAAPYTYDTWCKGYESDGIQQGSGTEEGADGFDNDGQNGADDPGEWETSPPFPVPLRGIQIRLRVFEKSSLAVQEITVNADFVK